MSKTTNLKLIENGQLDSKYHGPNVHFPYMLVQFNPLHYA